MASQPPETGRQALNRSLVDNAGAFADAAQQMAQGATATQAAVGALKNAALDKLLGPTALFAGGLIGALQTVRHIVRESGILEKGLRRIASVQGIQGKFETLLGSVTAAKRRIEELYRFTARSPFSFKDVAEANRTLQALTLGAFSGSKAMKLIGDTAAATGATMSETAERVGKLYNAMSSGRSLDKIIFQLQFTGIATEELIGKLEILEAEGATFASKWAEVEKVLKRTENGMKNAQSLDDYAQKLENARAMMEKAFGEPFVDAQVKAMQLMIAATSNLTPIIGEIGRDFAVIPNLIRDGKNSLLDTVAASHRFADALRIAYRVALSLFVGLAGATLAIAARNLAALGNAALSTAGSLRVAYAATLAHSKAQTTLAAATALSTAATKAFEQGSLFSAAALKAESVWLGAKTRALALNTAAAQAAGVGTAAYSLRTHAAGLATGAFAGALSLARKGLGLLVGLVRSSAVAFATNPWTAGAFAILSLATALWKWHAAASETAKESRELADSIAETTKRLDQQSAAVKSLDDWQRTVAKLRDRYAELTAEVIAFNRRVAQGEEPSREEIAANAKNVAEWRQTRVAMDKEMRRNTRNLDLSEREREFIKADQANARAAKDRDFRLAFQNAETPEQRLALLAGRREELEKRVADGRTAKAGEFTALRNGSAAARLRMEVDRNDLATRYDQQEQAAIDRRDRMMEERGAKRNGQGTWAGVAVSAETRDIYNATEKQLRALRLRRKVALEKADADLENVSLFSASPTVSAQARLDKAVKDGKGPGEIERLTRELEDARAAVEGLADAEGELAEITAQQAQESRDLAKLRAGQNIENEYDARINEAKAAGRPTRGLEFEKAIAQAELERTNAQTPEERQAAQNKIDALKAERLDGQRAAEIERRKNDALIAGDRKGARAVDDAAALSSLIDQYAGLGLSADRAREDFAARLQAEAAQRGPEVIASSIQRVGGGGGYAAADPTRLAAERAAKANEEQVKLLRDINAKLGIRPTPDPYTN